MNKPDAVKNGDCVVCLSRDVSIFMEISKVPVFCNVLWSHREDALAAPHADICLGFCRNCGHIFNIAFEPDRMEYVQSYENPLHFSPRFQEYAVSLVEHLVDRYGLIDKDIVEIGCGDGYFLKILCEAGNNRGIGFDPSHSGKKTDETLPERIAIIQDYYSEQHAHYKADFICCRHVLEHIRFPRDFLNSVRRTIGGRSDAVTFFEVPNVMFTLRDLGIWDLIYEHCSYFSSNSLAHLFHACGFDVNRLTESFGGQFLCIEAIPRKAPETQRPHDGNDFMRMRKDVDAFTEKYHAKIQTHKHNLKRLCASGENAVIWGAGSKGVTFLNVLGIREEMEYVVDINPHKHGKYIPGTGQRVVPPQFLAEYRPDLIFVMNPLYLEEIHKILEGLHLSARFINV
ncbi:class I SAM-dependent methyltransferase [Thermodesulfobacteriota bacterium]